MINIEITEYKCSIVERIYLSEISWEEFQTNICGRFYRKKSKLIRIWLIEIQ